jgi:putative transposase
VIHHIYQSQGHQSQDSGTAAPQKQVSVSELCALFAVSRSGYYAHRHKAQRRRRQEDEHLGQQMAEVFHANRAVYGSPRLVDALHQRGLRCGKNRIRRLMRERGLVAKHKRRRQPRTTQSHHALPVASNLLREVSAPTSINQQWVSDITYIATGEGWLYLAGTLDRYSRRLVGWQTSLSLASEVVLSATRRALKSRRPQRGLIYHSDRGCQYASRECQELLAGHGVQPSMSRVGNCYDNAMMESFWATLKTECFGDYVPPTRHEAKAMLFDYIEVFYNRQRAHSALGYLSPVQFEQQHVAAV